MARPQSIPEETFTAVQAQVDQGESVRASCAEQSISTGAYRNWAKKNGVRKMEPAAEWILIDDLTPWEQNPRHNEAAVDDVAKSIKRFGFGAPILARLQDHVVIAGHTRLKAAQKLGLDKVPVRFLDLDPAMARALALADNKLGEIAEWDDEALAAVLRDLEEQQVDFDGLGFSEEELDALLKEPASVGWEEFDESIGDDADAKAIECPHCHESFIP
jgi:hypothetical protein